jgi:DNA primase
LHQAGIENVVASGGTSLTMDQLRLIKKYTQNLTIIYDGDAAGIKASIRGIDLLLEEDMEVRACLFPNGDDPDSYIKKVGAQNFETYLKQNSKDFVTFKIALFADEDANDPYKRAELIKDMVASIMKIPNAIRRAVCFTQCAKALALDEQMLISEGNKILLEMQRGDRARARREEEVLENGAAETVQDLLDEINPPIQLGDPLLAAIEQYERESIRMVMQYGDRLLADDYYVADFYEEELSQLAFITPIYDRVYSIFKELMETGQLPTSQYFLQHPDQEIQQVAISILTVHERYKVSDIWFNKYEIVIRYEENELKTHVAKDMLRLKLKNTDKIMRDMIQKMADSTEEAELELMTLLLGYQTVKKTIAEQLGRVVG